MKLSLIIILLALTSLSPPPIIQPLLSERHITRVEGREKMLLQLKVVMQQLMARTISRGSLVVQPTRTKSSNGIMKERVFD